MTNDERKHRFGLALRYPQGKLILHIDADFTMPEFIQRIILKELTTFAKSLDTTLRENAVILTIGRVVRDVDETDSRD